MGSTDTAADRLYRAYFAHCQAADEDTTFNLLNALHSFNDQLRKAKQGSLFESVPFNALKKLRNYLHHEGELSEQLRPVGDIEHVFSADIARVCLVHRDIVDAASANDEASSSAFRWYGDVVDIEPAIFNAMVDAHETILRAKLRPTSKASKAFAKSYDYETVNAMPHKIEGGLIGLAGNVEELISAMHRAAAGSR